MPPNEKISDLDAAAPLVLTDHVLIARGAAAPNLKATIQAVLALSGGIGGGGTINSIPLWTSPGVLGDSIVTQFGSQLAIAGPLAVDGTFLSVVKSSPGGEVTLGVTNAADADPSSDALLVATVAGAGGGDPFTEWTVASEQSYVLGIDNSEDDKLVGSVGDTLGTANWLEVTTARGITLDAASGQTVALAVNSVEELQVSGTAVTIPTNDLVLPVGMIGTGGTPLVDAHFQGAATVRARIDHTGAGHTAILTGMSGVELLAGTMNTTSKYTAALKFMSTDPEFTTEPVKLGAVIVARATEAYAADTDGGMALDFFTSPNDVGATNAPILALTLGQDQNVGVQNDAPTLPLDVLAKAGITSIGGIAIKLTNKTGGITAKGQLVIASTSQADAFALADASDDRVIGIILDGGISDGGEVWIVVAGFAMVLMDGGGAALGDRIVSSGLAGSGLVDNGPIPAVHFQEIGHAVGSIGGVGLVKCAIHFN